MFTLILLPDLPPGTQRKLDVTPESSKLHGKFASRAEREHAAARLRERPPLECGTDRARRRLAEACQPISPSAPSSRP